MALPQQGTETKRIIVIIKQWILVLMALPQQGTETSLSTPSLVDILC